MLPFVLQALVILFDEFYFHWQRGLPRWERIGHPLDTLSTLACMLFVLLVPYSPTTLKIYIALATFSSLFITKDEFVHKEHCPGKELWLHALLFVLHPVALVSAGLIWPAARGGSTVLWLESWIDNRAELALFLHLQAAVMGLFLTYQLVYWNFIWKGTPKKQ